MACTAVLPFTGRPARISHTLHPHSRTLPRTASSYYALQVSVTLQSSLTEPSGRSPARVCVRLMSLFVNSSHPCRNHNIHIRRPGLAGLSWSVHAGFTPPAPPHSCPPARLCPQDFISVCLQGITRLSLRQTVLNFYRWSGTCRD